MSQQVMSWRVGYLETLSDNKESLSAYLIADQG